MTIVHLYLVIKNLLVSLILIHKSHEFWILMNLVACCEILGCGGGVDEDSGLFGCYAM